MNKTIHINTLITDIEQQLLTVYDDAILCRQYAWWTIESICKTTKTDLIRRNSITLSEAQQQTLADWLDQLITHKKPIQYLIGSVPFCEITILVEPPILIPRPETEEWCSNLIDQLKKLPSTPLTVLDLCCGSGCIAIALAQALPHVTVYAADISPVACSLTQKNKELNKTAHIHVIESDLFEQLPPDARYDVIVSNPPYITESEFATLDDSVKGWEDPIALWAPDDGLEIIKKIINTAPQFLKQNHLLADAKIPNVYMEIGYLQGPTVCALMRHENYTNVVITKDLEGKDRVVAGTCCLQAP